MSTPRSQRIGIWIIAIVMTIGTIGSFAVMVLANNNSASDQEKTNQAIAKYNQEMTAYQSKVTAQATELSAKYYPTFAKYESYPAPFSSGSVKKLTTQDLLVGDGATIDKKTSYDAYYIGWNPKGKIFDQSINTKTKSLKAPIAGANLIKGWEQGVIGMQIGGVRLISIPADLAYGASGQGSDIPPNTPLKFIVMAIPPVQTIPAPQYEGVTQ